MEWLSSREILLPKKLACSIYMHFFISFAEIDLEIFSTVILSLPRIQEGQLSVQFLAKE